jgi:hypothetical protein
VIRQPPFRNAPFSDAFNGAQNQRHLSFEIHDCRLSLSYRGLLPVAYLSNEWILIFISLLTGSTGL